jgi:hypothetical protein
LPAGINQRVPDFEGALLNSIGPGANMAASHDELLSQLMD